MDWNFGFREVISSRSHVGPEENITPRIPVAPGGDISLLPHVGPGGHQIRKREIPVHENYFLILQF